MSDTVKLIIEIPKDYYEIIKHDVENHLTDYRPFEIIGNGIPLDKIRKEVMEYIDDLDIAYEICGVFDNIGKESEVKPNE